LAHAGNGFLMRRGYAVIWLAWQGDLLPGNGRMVLDLPTVPAVTGPVRVEYIADRLGLTTFPLSGHASTRSHPTVSLDPREARLTRRRYPDDERIPVPPESWHFARIEGGFGLDNQGVEQALIPSDTHIHIPGGFEPGWIYGSVVGLRQTMNRMAAIVIPPAMGAIADQWGAGSSFLILGTVSLALSAPVALITRRATRLAAASPLPQSQNPQTEAR
jgi:hypothetical protein